MSLKTSSLSDTPVIIQVDQLRSTPWYADAGLKVGGTPLTQDDIKKIEGNRLPPAAHHRDEIIRLIYLATIAEEDKSPYSDNELDIFQKSDAMERRTIVALWGGLSISILLTFAALAGLTGGIDSLSNMDKAAIAVSVAVFAGLVINPLAYYATGFAPHFSSNAFNDKQDISERYAKTLGNAAKVLLTLAHGDLNEQRLAKAIVQNIDMDALKRKVQDALKNPVRGEDVIDSLSQVVSFLKSGNPEELRKESLRQFLIVIEQRDSREDSF